MREINIIYKEYKSIIKQNGTFIQRNDWLLFCTVVVPLPIAVIVLMTYAGGTPGFLSSIILTFVVVWMTCLTWGDGFVNDAVLYAIANSPVIPSEAKNEIMEEIQKSHSAVIDWRTLEKIINKANYEYNHRCFLADNAFMKAMKKE